MSIRRWFISKVFTQPNCGRTCSINNILLQFYYADEELNLIAAELDSFDGRKDPVRCTNLVNQLRSAQDKVITLIFNLMDEWKCERAPRDYRLKFPDELLSGEGAESLNGQIWFGAECLAAGSNILNHETESSQLRPMAKSVTTTLDQLRLDLRNLCGGIDDRDQLNFEIVCKLEQFDQLFTSFEYEYVKAMIPIKTADEIERLQDLIVLFSETLSYTIKKGLISQNEVDECQPRVMITVPRLAIVFGLMAGEETAICKKRRDHLSGLFKPFHNLLHRIRDLLHVLRPIEIDVLERMLSNEEIVSQPNITSGESISLISSPLKHKNKRSNSLPSIIPNVSTNLHKSVSSISLVTNLKDISVTTTDARKQNEHDNVSTNSSTTITTVASDDSFEIALAIIAKDSNYIPAQTKQLLHRLFVTISGVADQLQSNYASDMRNILRNVITLNSTPEEDDIDIEEAVEANELTEFTLNDLTPQLDDLVSHSQSDAILSRSTTLTEGTLSAEPSSDSLGQDTEGVNPNVDQPVRNDVIESNTNGMRERQLLLPPIWVPDELVSCCTLCSLQFNILRRRHHCRNCGQIYCNNCSHHFIPLAHYGFTKPVRVCNVCHSQAHNISFALRNQM